MENVMIIGILAVLILAGIIHARKHFKGEGGCCGGGSSTIRERKELDAPKVGEKTIVIEGMHCENCRNQIERRINKLDGVACEVHLKKKIAVVSYSKEVSNEQLQEMIEGLDFKVIEIR